MMTTCSASPAASALWPAGAQATAASARHAMACRTGKLGVCFSGNICGLLRFVRKDAPFALETGHVQILHVSDQARKHIVVANPALGQLADGFLLGPSLGSHAVQGDDRSCAINPAFTMHKDRLAVGVHHNLQKLHHVPLLRVPRVKAEEHTSELQSRGLISYAVFCLKKKNTRRSNWATSQQQSLARLRTGASEGR